MTAKGVEGEIKKFDAIGRSFEINNVKYEWDQGASVTMDGRSGSMADLKEGTKVKLLRGEGRPQGDQEHRNRQVSSTVSSARKGWRPNRMSPLVALGRGSGPASPARSSDAPERGGPNGRAIPRLAVPGRGGVGRVWGRTAPEHCPRPGRWQPGRRRETQLRLDRSSRRHA